MGNAGTVPNTADRRALFEHCRHTTVRAGTLMIDGARGGVGAERIQDTASLNVVTQNIKYVPSKGIFFAT